MQLSVGELHIILLDNSEFREHTVVMNEGFTILYFRFPCNFRMLSLLNFATSLARLRQNDCRFC
jgi:hypothetical protein